MRASVVSVLILLVRAVLHMRATVPSAPRIAAPVAAPVPSAAAVRLPVVDPLAVAILQVEVVAVAVLWEVVTDKRNRH